VRIIDVLETIIAKSLEYGVLGLACLVLVATIRLLWQRYDQIQEARLTEQKQHQENRVSDLKAIVDVVNKSSSTYEAMAHATTDRTRATDAVAEAQRATAAALERYATAVQETLNEIEEIQKAQERIVLQAQGCRDTMERLIERMDAMRRER
jgi:methyl-accepting chemotaxis protein